MLEYIVYENDGYIIAKKPSGLLSEEDPSGSKNLRQILEEYLLNTYPWKKQLICQLTNRLDKPVGGLLICAKKQSILKDLQHKFYLRKVDKLYFAIVEGTPEQPALQLNNYLVKSQTEFKAIPAEANNPHAKLARLSYRKIAESEGNSLLLVQLHTGKFHQIRFQLSQLGHPIWNDQWYGAQKINSEARIGLFSFLIGFEEPNTEQYRRFTLAPPEQEPWSYYSKEIADILNKIANGASTRDLIFSQ